MTNIEESLIRSHSLKGEGIELTGLKASKDIRIEIDRLCALKNNEVKDISNDIEISSQQLKDGLDTQREEIDTEGPIDFIYADYSDIIDNDIINYSDNFSLNYYVMINNTKYDRTVAFLNASNVLVIEVNNVLIDKPLIIEFSDEERLIQAKNQIKSADGVKLYSKNNKLQLDVKQHKKYKSNDVFKEKRFVLFLCSIAIVLSMQISIWAAVLFILTVISLNASKIKKLLYGHITNKKYYIDYGLDNELLVDDIIDAEKDSYNVNISEDNTYIIMNADEINAEWKIKNKGVLPDKFVYLFENIGFENLNLDAVKLEIKPTHKTSNAENSLISECGLWCINPQQTLEENLNLGSEKVTQYT